MPLAYAQEAVAHDPARFAILDEEDPHAEIWDHIHKLEAWARETHSTQFKYGSRVVPEKVIAFYTRPDGNIEKHQIFAIDYAAAKAKEPVLWTTDEPPPDVKVVTRIRTGPGQADMAATKVIRVYKQEFGAPIVKTGPFYPSDPATTRSPPVKPPTGGKVWTPENLAAYAGGGDSEAEEY